MPNEGTILQRNIGDLFRLFRQSNGFTQRQAAELCGTTQAQITYLEKGQGNLKLETLEKYAAAYGYSIEVGFTILEGDTRQPGEGFCSNCPDREGCSQGIPCKTAKSVNNTIKE